MNNQPTTYLNLTVRNRYRLTRKIGHGTFGDIYLAMDTTNWQYVAVKVEWGNVQNPHLRRETNVLRNLQGGVGVPHIFYYGPEGTYNCLVMELLGPSLSYFFDLCSGKFSVKTVSMLAEQAVLRLQFLHEKHYVHKDIKPANFVMGDKEQRNRLYLIDFGLSEKYRNEATLEHTSYQEGQPLCGSYIYASRNAHLGIKQSRRDDLESLGYVLVYFASGSLPWLDVPGVTRRQRMLKVGDIKMTTDLEVLCRGLPRSLFVYMRYCISLDYDELPDYTYMITLFRIMLNEAKGVFNYEYDWSVRTLYTTASSSSSSTSSLQNGF